jgi:flagellar biosynthetic protein FliR
MEDLMGLFDKNYGIILVLVFSRFLFIFAFLFLLSSRAINPKIKSSIALSFTLFTVSFTDFNLPEHIKVLELGILFFNQLLIGFTIAFIINIIFYAYKMFGELLSFSAGLSMAQLYDPSTGMQEQIFNKLFYIVIIYLFFYSGFYQTLIIGTQNLFIIFPLDYNLIGNNNIIEFVMEKISYTLLSIFIMSLPFFLITTLIDVYFGYSTRNTPAFNVFAVAFQVKFLLLFILLMILTPEITTNFSNMLLNLQEDFLNG